MTQEVGMKCLNCGSERVTESLAIEDDGAYPAGNHKVGAQQEGLKRLSKAASTRLHARVCVDCGFTALFAQNPSDLIS